MLLERWLFWPRWPENIEKDGIIACVGFLKVSWATAYLEQRQFLLISTQVSGEAFKTLFQNKCYSLACSPSPRSAGFCSRRGVGYGCAGEDFTLEYGGWWRCCCVASRVDEKFRTTLCSYWQCLVWKSAVHVVTLSTFKHAFGLESDTLLQNFFMDAVLQIPDVQDAGHYVLFTEACGHVNTSNW